MVICPTSNGAFFPLEERAPHLLVLNTGDLSIAGSMAEVTSEKLASLASQPRSSPGSRQRCGKAGSELQHQGNPRGCQRLVFLKATFLTCKCLLKISPL